MGGGAGGSVAGGGIVAGAGTGGAGAAGFEGELAVELCDWRSIWRLRREVATVHIMFCIIDLCVSARLFSSRTF